MRIDPESTAFSSASRVEAPAWDESPFPAVAAWSNHIHRPCRWMCFRPRKLDQLQGRWHGNIPCSQCLFSSPSFPAAGKEGLQDLFCCCSKIGTKRCEAPAWSVPTMQAPQRVKKELFRGGGPSVFSYTNPYVLILFNHSMISCYCSW